MLFFYWISHLLKHQPPQKTHNTKHSRHRTMKNNQTSSIILDLFFFEKKNTWIYPTFFWGSKPTDVATPWANGPVVTSTPVVSPLRENQLEVPGVWMHQPKRWLAGCWGFLNPTVSIRKIYMKKNIYFLLASIGSLHCPTFQRSGGSEGFVGSAVRNRTKLGVARAFGTKLSKLLRVWTDHHWTTPPVASYCHTYCTKPRQYRIYL